MDQFSRRLFRPSEAPQIITALQAAGKVEKQIPRRREPTPSRAKEARDGDPGRPPRDDKNKGLFGTTKVVA